MPSPSSESPSQRALGASTLALVVAVACLLAFMPGLNERLLGTPLRIVICSLMLATAILLHWIFLGIGLKRLGRSVLGWLALAVLLFPIGGAAALILLAWFNDEAHTPATAR